MSMRPGSSVRSPRSMLDGALGDRRGRDLDDAAVLDQHVTGLDDGAGVDVEHAGAAEAHGGLGLAGAGHGRRLLGAAAGVGPGDGPRYPVDRPVAKKALLR